VRHLPRQGHRFDALHGYRQITIDKRVSRGYAKAFDSLSRYRQSIGCFEPERVLPYLCVEPGSRTSLSKFVALRQRKRVVQRNMRERMQSTEL
jgi:hypothetical protein